MAKTARQLIVEDQKIKARIAKRTQAIRHTSGVLHSLDNQRRSAHLSDEDRREIDKQYQEEKRRMKNLRDGMTKDLKAEKKIEDQIMKLPPRSIQEMGRDT